YRAETWQNDTQRARRRRFPSRRSRTGGATSIGAADGAAASCRSRARSAGLPGDVVLVSRNELDGLQDRLYQLRCALEDAQTLLTEKPTKAELERQLT